MDLVESSTVNPGEHWYFLHKRNVLIKTICRFAQNRSLVIDVGAGTGYFANEIVSRFPNIEVTCVDTNFQPNHLGKLGNVTYVNNASNIEGFEIVLFMDVIEHVLDDRALVNDYLSRASSDALVVFTVPAFNWLWSGHDIALKHYRRYSRKQLESVALDLNLTILSAQYLFTPIFPFVLLKRLRKRAKSSHNDLQPQSNFMNKFMLAVLQIDYSWLGKYLPGSTAILIATIN